MIKATAIEKNGLSFADCLNNLPVVRLPFGADLRVGNEMWMVPVGEGGVFRGYKHIAYTTGSSAPTPDSFRATTVGDVRTGDFYVIAATADNITAAADGATIAPVTIPVPVIAYKVCADTSGNYNYSWDAGTKAAGDEYRAHVMVNNAQAVAALAGGHTSIAAMVTWLNTNYAAAGTWSNPSGNIIKLVNTDGKTVGLTVTIGNYT